MRGRKKRGNSESQHRQQKIKGEEKNRKWKAVKRVKCFDSHKIQTDLKELSVKTQEIVIACKKNKKQNPHNTFSKKKGQDLEP